NNDEPLESICLKEILGKKPEMVDIIEAFKEGFSQLGYPIKPSIISREEECRVTELIKERYGSDEWTLGR
ncbi:MAG: hypothetical protein PF447_13060, partial [Spirochaetaceae bacterium]|nr:hypothetical protein [Spirochaetaceae bacterium]